PERLRSSLGGTLAALRPPSAWERVPALKRGWPEIEGSRLRTPSAHAPVSAAPAKPDVLIGTGRERRLVERVAAATRPALVIVPDIEAAGRWAQRLDKHGRVARLDSGVDDATRASAWAALAAGDVRLAVGTRSALLAPLPAGATLALVDEHEAAHKPPGPPRLHSRDFVLERAARGGLDAVLTSATPSVETWWRADSGRARLVPGESAAWPLVQMADTRGILKVEPLTPALARAVRETLAAGRRAFLVVSRPASALACDECGVLVRCPECGVALAYPRAARTLASRGRGRAPPTPE